MRKAEETVEKCDDIMTECFEEKSRKRQQQKESQSKVEQKKAILETIMRNQKAAKHFTKAAREPSSNLSVDELPGEVEKAHQETDSIINVIRKLQTDVPELSDRLERIIPIAVQ